MNVKKQPDKASQKSQYNCSGLSQRKEDFVGVQGNTYSNKSITNVKSEPVVAPFAQRIKMEHNNTSESGNEVSPTKFELEPDSGLNATVRSFRPQPNGTLVPMGQEGERTFIITKISKKKSNKTKETKMISLIHSHVSDCNVNDTPLFSVTAHNVRSSDVFLLELKEFDNDNEPEPFYNYFGHDPELILKQSPFDPEGDYKKNCACGECEFEDICDKYRFGPYCVQAVKRYYEENKFFVTMKDAYIVYISHYNRALDYVSFNRDQKSKGLRSTEINKSPHCMVEQGSLKHSLYWTKWNVEYG